MTDLKEKVRQTANEVGNSIESDILLLNAGIDPGLDFAVFRALMARGSLRKNLLLYLCTEGGSADVAYRTMRHLQRHYETITIIVGGWCKSAGTLMCIGANRLVIAPLGELGPIDVQLAKTDELFESSSGLAIDSAFQKLQIEYAKLFIQNVLTLKNHFKNRMSFKTAVNASLDMSSAAIKPIFEKFDPLSIGEDYRSYRIAEEYGERLDAVANNLRRDEGFDALDMLLGGYPSHGFVIDYDEASALFQRVGRLDEHTGPLLDALNRDGWVPKSSKGSEKPRIEYLNDGLGEDGQDHVASTRADSATDTSADTGAEEADAERGAAIAMDDTPSPTRRPRKKPRGKNGSAADTTPERESDQ